MITRLLKICGLNIELSEKNIHIEDSYKVTTRKDMELVLNTLREYVQEAGITTDTPLNHRSNKSMIREWVTHNNFYNLGYFREETRSVDLNYPQLLIEKLGYAIYSIIVV